MTNFEFFLTFHINYETQNYRPVFWQTNIGYMLEKIWIQLVFFMISLAFETIGEQ